MNGFDDFKIVAPEFLDRWRVGDKIDNKYEIVRIEQGGMGVVYLCFDEQTKVPLAIKTVQYALLKGRTFMERSESVARFKQEAEAWVRLEKNLNIVQAFLVQEIEGMPYIFLEYVAGDEQYGIELYDWIHRGGLQVRGQPDIPLILNFSIQFCHGMMYAESKFKEMGRPFVHRDIKPSNILITRDKVVKITDFGSVKSSAERGERIVGETPQYMSPEQWKGTNIDTRSDIYCFGGVLYQMVTGRLPFTTANLDNYRECHLNSIPEIPETDEQLKEIIMKCLEKDPARRYQDFNDLEKALAALYFQLTKARVEVPEGKSLEAWELLTKGLSLAELGYYDEAIVYLLQCISSNPNDADAHNNLGVIYGRQDKLKEAIIEYKEAIRINPNDAEPHYNLGVIYGRQDKLEEAVQHYKEAIRSNPNDADAHNNLGLIYEHQGKLEEAIIEYKEAIRSNPNNAEAHNNLGVIYFQQDKMEKAEQHFREAIRVNPNYPKAHNNLGITLMELCRNVQNGGEHDVVLDEALRHFLAAESLEKGIASYNLTRVFALKGNVSRAFLWFEIALIASPTLSRLDILRNTDLESIKMNRQFKRILDKYRPE